MGSKSTDEYQQANLKRWDESVAIHVNSSSGVYSLAAFKAGKDILCPPESDEVGDVADKDILHLQCHFGLDTLSLARRGARVTGLDFSPKAIEAARALSAETCVPGRFVLGNVYDAPDLIEERFDVVYVTVGAINWLPDLARWAKIVAHFLRPGGYLYLLDGHPAALAFENDDAGRPVLTYPYFPSGEPLMFENYADYADETIVPENSRTYEWVHPISEILNALLAAGLRLDWFNEHDVLPWKLFDCMETDENMRFRMPDDVPPMPLSFSLKAIKS